MPRVALIVAALLAMSSASAGPTAAQTLSLAQRIALPEVRGRIDHLAVDLDQRRLFVAALGAGSVEVVDLRAGQRNARIGSLREPQGVAYLAGQHRLAVASGGSGDVLAFDDPAAGPAARAGGLGDADNLRVDAAAKRLYVGHDGGLTALDPVTWRPVQRIALAGHPEAFVLERGSANVYVNVPSARHIAVVDRVRGTVTATWPIRDASRNFPMTLDEANRRLFVITRQPALLLVHDTASGERVATLPVCGDADDLFFDDARHRLYAVCGSGEVDVIAQRTPDRYDVAQRVSTASGARTGLFVPELSMLFVAAPASGAAAAEIRVYKVE
jgi:DNA-binding beta-propeller fold protein YncE